MRSVVYSLFSLLLVVSCNVQSKAQCMNGAAPSVLNISIDSATVTWAAVSGAAGYEYAVQLAILPQPTTGTPVTGTTIRVGGLTPNASHKAWLRNDCGSGNYSPWNAATFTTSCGSPGLVYVSHITNNSVDVNWGVVGGASGYEYVVDQTPGDPVGSGTAVGTINTVNITGLSDSTFYYAHVRTICGGTIYSGWATQMFFTAYPAGLNTLTGNETPAIKIYPNPATNFINIESSRLLTGRVSVLNLMGSVVHQASINDTKLTIDISTLASGLYILKYTDESNSFSAKVFKR